MTERDELTLDEMELLIEEIQQEIRDVMHPLLHPKQNAPTSLSEH